MKLKTEANGTSRLCQRAGIRPGTRVRYLREKSLLSRVAKMTVYKSERFEVSQASLDMYRSLPSDGNSSGRSCHFPMIYIISIKLYLT